MRIQLLLSSVFGLASCTYVCLLWWQGKQAYFRSVDDKDENQTTPVVVAVNSVNRPVVRRRSRGILAHEPFKNRLDAFKQKLDEKKETKPRRRRQQQQQQQGLQVKRKKVIINPDDNRPPYYELVDQDGNITASVEDLLHFAVVGFGKCGTTSMISWLDEHHELQTYPREIYDLMFGRVGEFVRKIYTMPVGHYKRGYKSPADASYPRAVEYIAEYFPKTRLIVGIRHPVLWFESLYNFRVQNLHAEKDHSVFPTPEELIGRCTKNRVNTCTWKGEFALHLRNFGKTVSTHNPTKMQLGKRGKKYLHYELTPFEQRMYRSSYTKTIPTIQRAIPNPVFLFEIGQLQDNNTARAAQFRKDIESFLDLEAPLPEMVHKKPGKKWDQYGREVQEVKDTMKISICDDEHIRVRKELMRIARMSSVWIRKYFLHPAILSNPDLGVHVSSPDFLHQLLIKWMEDPCPNKEATMDAGRVVIKGGRKHWDVDNNETVWWQEFV